MKLSKEEFNQFVGGHIQCALWATNDESDESGGVPLDKNYAPSDIARDSMERIVADCKSFTKKMGNLPKYSQAHVWPPATIAGQDFFLTRNGHGTGFWDRDLGDEGERLTKLAKEMGEVWFYVGDDRQIHCN